MLRTNVPNQDIARLEQRIKQNPDDLDALVELGALRFEPGHDPESAEDLLRRALELDPKNTDARFWLAKVCFHDYVDLPAARRMLDDAIRLDPRRADCLSLMASVLADLDEPSAAYVDLLATAVQVEPEWPSLRHQYANALLRLGKIKEAAEQVRVGLEIARRCRAQSASSTYYETAVTGREWPDMVADLEGLLRTIEVHRGRAER